MSRASLTRGEGRPRFDLDPSVRSFTVENYVILYSVEEDDVDVIQNVLHGNQDFDSYYRQ